MPRLDQVTPRSLQPRPLVGGEHRGVRGVEPMAPPAVTSSVWSRDVLLIGRCSFKNDVDQMSDGVERECIELDESANSIYFNVCLAGVLRQYPREVSGRNGPAANLARTVDDARSRLCRRQDCDLGPELQVVKPGLLECLSQRAVVNVLVGPAGRCYGDGPCVTELATLLRPLDIPEQAGQLLQTCNAVERRSALGTWTELVDQSHTHRARPEKSLVSSQWSPSRKARSKRSLPPNVPK